MTIPKTYKGLRRFYESLDADVKDYVSKLDPLLADGQNYEIALAYCFLKLDEGHHRALKCGLVRLHDCAPGKVDSFLEKLHFTIDTYSDVFTSVFGKPIPPAAKAHLVKAQVIRNRLTHGQKTTDQDRCEAIYFALAHMSELGEFVRLTTGKNPYGDLRGLAGRRKILSAPAMASVLNGVGLGAKSDALIA